MSGGIVQDLVADLAIDYEKRRVTVAGRPVRLTVTEYESSPQVPKETRKSRKKH